MPLSRAEALYVYVVARTLEETGRFFVDTATLEVRTGPGYVGLHFSRVLNAAGQTIAARLHISMVLQRAAILRCGPHAQELLRAELVRYLDETPIEVVRGSLTPILVSDEPHPIKLVLGIHSRLRQLLYNIRSRLDTDLGARGIVPRGYRDADRRTGFEISVDGRVPLWQARESAQPLNLTPGRVPDVWNP